MTGRGRAQRGPDAAGDWSSLQALVDLLSRRHALAVVEFLRGPAQSFRGVAARLGAGEAQVSQRLRELREAGLIEVDEAGDYRLTSTGRRMLDDLERLADFADGWAQLSPRQRGPRGSAVRGRGEGDG